MSINGCMNNYPQRNFLGLYVPGDRVYFDKAFVSTDSEDNVENNETDVSKWIGLSRETERFKTIPQVLFSIPSK